MPPQLTHIGNNQHPKPSLHQPPPPTASHNCKPQLCQNNKKQSTIQLVFVKEKNDELSKPFRSPKP
jgi:hypothetical protein